GPDYSRSFGEIGCELQPGSISGSKIVKQKKSRADKQICRSKLRPNKKRNGERRENCSSDQPIPRRDREKIGNHNSDPGHQSQADKWLPRQLQEVHGGKLTAKFKGFAAKHSTGNAVSKAVAFGRAGPIRRGRCRSCDGQ